MRKSKNLFYGWKVAGVAFLANFMAVGTAFYALNAFLEPLCELKGWSRTSVNIAPMLGTFFGLVCQLFYGTIVGKVGPRLLMTIGSLVSGTAFLLLGQVEKIGWFYIYYVLLYLGNGAYAGIVANTVVNNWFVLERGKALGFATSGMSLSGVIFPFLFMLILTKWDLAMAFGVGGFLIMSMAPLSWKVVRNWPEEMGLSPDGRGRLPKGLEVEKGPQNPRTPPKLQSLGLLIKTGTFWRLGLGYALLMAGSVGVMSQLKPRLVEIGLGHMEAMGLTSFGALMGSVGKYLWGYLCDKKSPALVVSLMALMNGVGIGFSLIGNVALTTWLFVSIFGLSMGGIMSTFPIIVAHTYGRENFPFVIRYLYLILSFQLIGYLMMGQSFDKTGSYGWAYICFLGMDLLAAFLLYGLRKAKQELALRP